MSRAKRNAESIVCCNNLRQQGIALTAYLGDFGVYPVYSTEPSPSADAQGQLVQRFWLHELGLYVDDKWPEDNFSRSRTRPSPRGGVYACPGYNRVRGMYQTFTQGARGAYGYNRGGIVGFPIVLESCAFYGLGSMDGLGDVYQNPSSNTNLDARPVPENQVISPSQMIVIGDSEIINPLGSPPDEIVGSIGTPLWFENLMYNELTRGLASPITAPARPLLPTDKAMIDRHAGRWNLLFCDGHVESKKIGALINRNDEVLRLWSRDNRSHRKSGAN